MSEQNSPDDRFNPSLANKRFDELQGKPSALEGQTRQDPHALTLTLQKELKRAGCDPGELDGLWGQKTQSALERFSQSTAPPIPTSTPELGLLGLPAEGFVRERDIRGAGRPLPIGHTKFWDWVRDGTLPKPVKAGSMSLFEVSKIRQALRRLAAGELR